MKLILLILSMPTENATIRMRAWRTLKASGAAVLRDGVYLLPERESCLNTLEAVAADVLSGGGSAFVLHVEEPDAAHFIALFDRSEGYAILLADITKVREMLTTDTVMKLLKPTRKLRKTFASLSEIDFFPSEAQRQTEAALQELEVSTAQALSPNEPHAINAAITRLSAHQYQGRTWATRRRPWVDRLACAWLIHRFIDPQANLLWLESPNECPADALSFDFDGATFSHVGNRVSFEVLLASFELEQPALKRIGALVHYLDVGGVQPPESAGIESVLAGLRATIPDDDQLFAMASNVFDGLLATFQQESMPQRESS
jgi:hypothetical protein